MIEWTHEETLTPSDSSFERFRVPAFVLNCTAPRFSNLIIRVRENQESYPLEFLCNIAKIVETRSSDNFPLSYVGNLTNHPYMGLQDELSDGTAVKIMLN